MDFQKKRKVALTLGGSWAILFVKLNSAVERKGGEIRIKKKDKLKGRAEPWKREKRSFNKLRANAKRIRKGSFAGEKGARENQTISKKEATRKQRESF